MTSNSNNGSGEQKALRTLAQSAPQYTDITLRNTLVKLFYAGFDMAKYGNYHVGKEATAIDEATAQLTALITSARNEGMGVEEEAMCKHGYGKITEACPYCPAHTRSELKGNSNE